MKTYRFWVYKIAFWFFCQVACFLAYIISGDILKIWREGVEFDIKVEEEVTS